MWFTLGYGNNYRNNLVYEVEPTMITTIYIMFLVFGMVACITAIACSVKAWLDSRMAVWDEVGEWHIDPPDLPRCDTAD